MGRPRPEPSTGPARGYGPIASIYLLLTAVTTAVTTFGYVRLLGQQGSAIGDSSRVVWVLTFMVSMAMVAGLGAFARRADVRAVAPIVLLAGFAVTS